MSVYSVRIVSMDCMLIVLAHCTVDMLTAGAICLDLHFCSAGQVYAVHGLNELRHELRYFHVTDAGNSTYLSSAMTYKARSLEEETDAARNYNVWNYQNSLPGVNLLLAQATDFATNEYTLATKGFMIVWMSGKYTIR